jgi:endonuclease YncB( thermonuclease family)
MIYPTKRFNPVPVSLAVMLTAASTGVWAEGGSFVGRVVGVTDGDTITVLDRGNSQHTIRMAYIDAPETTCHANKPSAYDDACIDHGQPFAKASKKALSNMVYAQEVSVSVLPGSSYGREIGTVYVYNHGNLLNVNYEMVKSGMAWFYRYYAKKQLGSSDFEAFSQAESHAQATGMGLWKDKNPTPPWDYRHENKGGTKNRMSWR